MEDNSIRKQWYAQESLTNKEHMKNDNLRFFKL